MRGRGTTGLLACGGRGGTRGGVLGVGAGGVLGGAIPGTHPPRHRIGIARAQPIARTPFLRPPRHSRAPAGPLRTPWLPALRYAPGSQYGRDSIKYILKLVKTWECHRKSSMRPGIVPVSKSRPIITTLNFPDFRFGQPSLHRNKWS